MPLKEVSRPIRFRNKLIIDSVLIIQLTPKNFQGEFYICGAFG